MDHTAGQMTFPCPGLGDKGKRHFWSNGASSARWAQARLSLAHTWHDFVLMARDCLSSFRRYLDKLHDLASILANERRRAE